jgi:isopenicillin N synthase-like dioxygenase
MISLITGGLYKSSIHRVVNKNPTDRFSVVYFFDGNIDFKLYPLDVVHGKGIGEDDKAPTVEEHMIVRTLASYGMKKSS